MVILKVGKHMSERETLADAVAYHNDWRDESGLGASKWPMCSVVMPDGTEYRISYNGRVWTAPYGDPTCVEVTAHLTAEA